VRGQRLPWQGPGATSACRRPQQQDDLAGGGAGCSLSWMPPAGCWGAAALGSLQEGSPAARLHLDTQQHSTAHNMT
jgi:hypothetical protein